MTGVADAANTANTLQATMTLEEYKTVNEHAQFVMTRYMQALALYLTFVGFGLREVIASAVPMRTVILVVAMTCGNLLAFYGAEHFRRMAYHALDRQTQLADALGFQRPYPMIWGYQIGVIAFGVVELGLIAILVRTFVS